MRCIFKVLVPGQFRLPFVLAILLAMQLPFSLAKADAGVIQESAAAAAVTSLPASLPLKRDVDEGAGIGVEAATLTAGGLLMLGVWAAARFRRRQLGAAGRAAPASLPWLGQLLAGRERRTLRVIETAPLTSQVRLHVVAWQGTEYLVSSSPGAVSVLDKRQSPPASASEVDAFGAGPEGQA